MFATASRFMRVLAIPLAFAVLAGPLAAQTNELEPGWDLDPAASNLRFQSVKKETVVEASSFATFTGAITPAGTAEVRVLLDSVDTKIDLRNVRMRFLFFETFKFPEAVVRAEVDPALIAGLREARRKTVTMPFDLTLHGVTNRLQAEVSVTLLTDDRVSVASAAPVSIAVADFGLTENIAKLEEAASVSITPSAVVTFDFVFARRTGAAPAPAAPTEAPASAALEAEGDFSLEACVGRFEILSRTGNIYFLSGSARLSDDSVPLLTSVVDIVRRCPGLRIEVAGHTDADGSEAANQRLSEARAQAVANYLTGKGIAGEVLTVRGYGEARPVAPNDTAAGKARNRRIEFVVVGG